LTIASQFLGQLSAHDYVSDRSSKDVSRTCDVAQRLFERFIARIWRDSGMPIRLHAIVDRRKRRIQKSGVAVSTA
jgi:hypothetical protein